MIGCPPNGLLRGVIRDGEPYDYDTLEQEVVGCAKELVSSHPNVGAIVLECTQLPVFARAIQEEVKLPVYDVFTLGSWFYSGLVRMPFPAWTEREVEAATKVRPRNERERMES